MFRERECVGVGKCKRLFSGTEGGWSHGLGFSSLLVSWLSAEFVYVNVAIILVAVPVTRDGVIIFRYHTRL